MGPVDGQDTVGRVIHRVSRQNKGIRAQINRTGYNAHHRGMAFHEGDCSGDLVFPNNGISADDGTFLHRTAGHYRAVTDAALATDFSFIGNEGRTAYPGLSSQEAPVVTRALSQQMASP